LVAEAGLVLDSQYCGQAIERGHWRKRAAITSDTRSPAKENDKAVSGRWGNHYAACAAKRPSTLTKQLHEKRCCIDVMLAVYADSEWVNPIIR